jgi:hypothetical protein
LYMYREYTVWVCFWTCQFPWRHRALVGPPVISFVHHHQWKSVNNGGDKMHGTYSRPEDVDIFFFKENRSSYRLLLLGFFSSFYSHRERLAIDCAALKTRRRHTCLSAGAFQSSNKSMK